MAIHENSFEQARVAVDRARATVGSYPNVVGVGVGTKRIAGVATEIWCVSISVRSKLPPGQLPTGTQVPAYIDGVPTDVIELGDFARTVVTDRDGLECYELGTDRPLRGGIKLGIAYASTTGILPDTPNAGTLGCIALTNETPARHVALTNWHVIREVLPNGPIGQPTVYPSSTSSACCGSSTLIGNVYKYAKDKIDPNSTGRSSQSMPPSVR